MFLRTNFKYLNNDSEECFNKPINLDHVITYNTFDQERMGRFGINFKTVNDDVNWYFSKESNRAVALENLYTVISDIEYQQDVRNTYFENNQYS